MESIGVPDERSSPVMTVVAPSPCDGVRRARRTIAMTEQPECATTDGAIYADLAESIAGSA